MGLGHTLMEHYLFDDEGRIRNLGAIDYRIPTSMDLPKSMESEIVENGDGPGPYGAKGMSEGALLCVAPAVAAAVRDADGRGDPRPAAVAGAGLARAAGAPEAEARRMTRTYALDAPFDLAPDELRALIGGKAAEPRGDARSRPAAAGAAGVRDHDRGLPRVPRRRAGRTGSTRSSATRMAERRGARPAGGSATRPIRCWSASDPARRVSMPGMMDTILNLGLTDGHDRGPRAASPATRRSPRACRDRLASMFASIVGASPCPTTRGGSCGWPIEAVFRSWNSDRAQRLPPARGHPRRPRHRRSPSRRWCSATAAPTRRPASRSRATRRPASRCCTATCCSTRRARTSSPAPIATEPIARARRAPARGRRARCREAATRLEHHLRDLCDIEFTIEQGRLWLLQVRAGKRSPQAALRIAVDMAKDPSFPLTREEAVRRVAPLLADPPTFTTGRSGYVLPLVTGLGASPGVASGEIVTTPDAAVAAAEAGRRVILVRAETSPDDVHGMSRVGRDPHGAAAGSRATPRSSRAAGAFPRSSGRPGCGSATARSRSTAGPCATARRSRSTARRARCSRARSPAAPRSCRRRRRCSAGRASWASPSATPDEPVASGEPAAGVARRRRRPPPPATLDACVRRLGTKGFATTASLAEALLRTPDAVQPLLDQLVVDGVAASVAGAYRLTDAGSERAAAFVAADRDGVGRRGRRRGAGRVPRRSTTG